MLSNRYALELSLKWFYELQQLIQLQLVLVQHDELALVENVALLAVVEEQRVGEGQRVEGVQRVEVVGSVEDQKHQLGRLRWDLLEVRLVGVRLVEVQQVGMPRERSHLWPQPIKLVESKPRLRSPTM